MTAVASHPAAPADIVKKDKLSTKKNKIVWREHDTWKEEFGESDHFHHTKAYHSSLCIVTILHSVCETSAQRHHVLSTTHKTQSHMSVHDDYFTSVFIITSFCRVSIISKFGQWAQLHNMVHCLWISTWVCV